MVAVLLALLSAAPAAAHGDVILADHVVEIAPHGTATFQGEVHYHRLIGVITAGVDVSVRFARTADDAVAFETPPGNEVRLNTLIRCCDDRTWTPYTLTLRNHTSKLATVRADARLVHDDLAVMAYQAEAGTRESVLIIGGIWLALLWAGSRRRDQVRPLASTAWAFIVLLAVVAALTIYGTARYGIGGAPGLVAALSDIPILPTNPIVSRAALLLLVSGIAWSWILVRWAATSTGPRWTLLGIGLVASVTAVALAMIGGYGEAGIPVAFTAVAAGPIAVVMAARSLRA